MGASDAISRFTAPPFFRFAIAGALGFATDALVLSALMNGLGATPLLARLASFSTALFVTWTVNRNWTFAAAPPRSRRFLLYVGVQLAGAVLNFTTFSVTLALAPALKAYPAIALVPAALAGLCATYLGAKHIAFVSNNGTS